MSPRVLGIFTLLAASLGSTGCSRDAEAGSPTDEIERAVDSIKEHTTSGLEAAKKELAGEWSELEADLARLRAAAAEEGKTLAADTKAMISRLDKEADEALAALARARDAGAEDASRMLDELGDAAEAARQAVKEAWEELGRK